MFSETELRGWRLYGEELMSDCATGRSLPGTRPWGFWRFELGEDPSDEPAVRLAELGLLRDDEVAAIAELERQCFAARDCHHKATFPVI